jgi:DNA-directed RNA polymerase subunit omega
MNYWRGTDMIHPSIDALLKKADSRFALCIVIGKRARQLISGADVLVNYKSQNAVTLALNEISEDKISFVPLKNPVKK